MEVGRPGQFLYLFWEKVEEKVGEQVEWFGVYEQVLSFLLAFCERVRVYEQVHVYEQLHAFVPEFYERVCVYGVLQLLPCFFCYIIYE